MLQLVSSPSLSALGPSIFFYKVLVESVTECQIDQTLSDR